MNTQLAIATRPICVDYVGPVAPVTRGDLAAIDHHSLAVWADARAVEIDPRCYTAAPVPSMVRDRLAVMAARSIGQALGSIHVQESVGRVYLVAFKGYRVPIDPVLPFVLASLGNDYERAFCRFAHHVEHYLTGAQWFRRAQRLCDRAIERLPIDVLNAPELAYLVVKLQAALAWPRGEAYHRERHGGSSGWAERFGQ